MKNNNKKMMRTTKIVKTCLRNYSSNIIKTNRISTQQNTDMNYKEIGVVHYTNSQGINGVRQLGTSITTLFGYKGFDTSVYDELRNESLEHVDKLLEDKNAKLCNMRMEFTHVGDYLVLHHVYGTLLKKE